MPENRKKDPTKYILIMSAWTRIIRNRKCCYV
jgi:hypothetical protein